MSIKWRTHTDQYRLPMFFKYCQCSRALSDSLCCFCCLHLIRIANTQHVHPCDQFIGHQQRSIIRTMVSAREDLFIARQDSRLPMTQYIVIYSLSISYFFSFICIANQKTIYNEFYWKSYEIIRWFNVLKKSGFRICFFVQFALFQSIFEVSTMHWRCQFDRTWKTMWWAYADQSGKYSGLVTPNWNPLLKYIITLSL